VADPLLLLNSRENLRRVRGGRDGTYPFLEVGTWDTVHYFDDFLGDEIRGSDATPGLYQVQTTTDGAITILANQPNGVAEIRASDGNGADNEYCGISLPELAFTGDRNSVMAVRVAVDAIATVKMEFGFTDVTTDAGAVNVLATPSATAANAAMWVLDTDDNAYWQGFGVAAGTLATKYEPAISPVAATFETLVVALRDGFARFIRLDSNGRMTVDSQWQASFITKTTALVPWMFVQLRTGTLDRNVQVDFIDVRARRTVS
jgi:hypothetical protein